MITPTPNSGALKALLILHKAMLAAPVVFALIAFYLVYSGSVIPGDNYFDKILQVIAVALSAGGFYLGNFLFQKKISEARESSGGAKERLDLYRAGCISQWALLELPGMFAIICFLLTGNYAFLALAAVLILIFAMKAPSKLKIAFYLQLGEEDLADL